VEVTVNEWVPGVFVGEKAKFELADEAVVNHTIPGHIYRYMTFSLSAPCSTLPAQVHREFSLALYKNK
jgi:hypothetical protein